MGGIATGNVISYGVDAKLVDVPELGYTSEDKPHPRGEICVKTPDMISGKTLHPPMSPPLTHFPSPPKRILQERKSHVRSISYYQP